MLQTRLNTPPRLQTQTGPLVCHGKDLARQARKGNATDRALLAVETVGATIDGVTVAQATTLAGANPTYVAALRSMTELEQADVKAGRIKLSDRCNRRKPISDAEFDALVLERADRALAVLCVPVNDTEFAALVRARAEEAWVVLDQLTAPNCELRTDELQTSRNEI
jgi:hypothetical protein